MSKRVVLGSLLFLGAVCSMGLSTIGTTAVSASDKVEASDAKASRPHMDLAFCIDTTGSMQGEIDMVKSKTKSLVAQLSSGKPAPIVRVGVVAYRDQGDAYVTKVFPFSDDIDKVVKDISELKADGGGDGPEAVDKGLHAAIKELKWSEDKHTAKILFLIGDAGSHGGSDDVDWRSDCRGAIASGIQINTIGCAGLENYPSATGVDVFKQIAHLADGKFESLAYRQEIVDATGKKSTIVNAGGTTFALAKSATAGDAWKKEVAAGAMKPVAPGTGIAQAAVRTMGMPKGLRATASFASAGAGGAGYAAMPLASPAPAMSLPVSRADNNLDDIMLRDAKKRAESVLK